MSPPHLLSLPAETLDAIVNYLPRPIDAINLSMTCRYFQQHLSPHNNLLWYHFCSSIPSMPTIPTDSHKEYDPTYSYKSCILDALRLFTCNFCLRHLSNAPKNNRRRKSDDSYVSVHGFRLSKSAFRYLPLVLEPPPRFSEAPVYCRWQRSTIMVRFYWALDIDELCLAQNGCTLGVLKSRREAERREKEAHRKANPSSLEILREEIKNKFHEEAWKIWQADELYHHARTTFGKDIDYEAFTSYLERSSASEVAQGALKAVRGRTASKLRGDAWVSKTAREMVGKLEDSSGYQQKCYDYHVRRIAEDAEKAGTVSLLEQLEVCPIKDEAIDGTGLEKLVKHVQDHHKEEFWKGTFGAA
ncbi:hypothetical protein RUND412_005205 [Rhizina undulata]